MRTRLGAITIASAAVDDATGWILLASVAAVVNGKFEFWSMLRMIGLTLLFAATMIFLVRPLLVRWVLVNAPRPGGNRAERSGGADCLRASLCDRHELTASSPFSGRSFSARCYLASVNSVPPCCGRWAIS